MPVGQNDLDDHPNMGQDDLDNHPNGWDIPNGSPPPNSSPIKLIIHD